MFGLFKKKTRDVWEIDLYPIIEGVEKRYLWTRTRAMRAADDYYKFLYLLKTFPEDIFAPWNDDMDIFWHEHILHTKKYAEDCKMFLGEFIHHDPTISDSPRKERDARKNSVLRMRQQFGSRRKEKGDAEWFKVDADDIETGIAAIIQTTVLPKTSVPQYQPKKESDYDHGATAAVQATYTPSHGHHHHTPYHSDGSGSHSHSHVDTGGSHHSCGSSCGGHHG